MYSICNEFHARWGASNTYSLYSMCYELHVCLAPCVQGSMYAGLHAYRVPFVMNSRVPGSCVSGSMYAGFHVCWVSCTPGSKHSGFHLLPVLVLRVLPVMNSNHTGFHSCRTPTTPAPCRPGPMCYEFLCVGLCSGFHLL